MSDPTNPDISDISDILRSYEASVKAYKAKEHDAKKLYLHLANGTTLELKPMNWLERAWNRKNLKLRAIATFINSKKINTNDPEVKKAIETLNKKIKRHNTSLFSSEPADDVPSITSNVDSAAARVFGHQARVSSSTERTYENSSNGARRRSFKPIIEQPNTSSPMTHGAKTNNGVAPDIGKQLKTRMEQTFAQFQALLNGDKYSNAAEAVREQYVDSERVVNEEDAAASLREVYPQELADAAIAYRKAKMEYNDFLSRSPEEPKPFHEIENGQLKGLQPNESLYPPRNAYADEEPPPKVFQRYEGRKATEQQYMADNTGTHDSSVEKLRNKLTQNVQQTLAQFKEVIKAGLENRPYSDEDIEYANQYATDMTIADDGLDALKSLIPHELLSAATEHRSALIAWNEFSLGTQEVVFDERVNYHLRDSFSEPVHEYGESLANEHVYDDNMPFEQSTMHGTQRQVYQELSQQFDLPYQEAPMDNVQRQAPMHGENELCLTAIRPKIPADSVLPGARGKTKMTGEEHICAMLYDKLIEEYGRTDVAILALGNGNIPPHVKLSPDVRFIISPCAVANNSHNTVLVIDRQKEEYFYYDSLDWTTGPEFNSIIQNHVNAGYLPAGPDANNYTTYTFNPARGTLQNDGWSCGFHAVENAVKTVENADEEVTGSIRQIPSPTGEELRNRYRRNFNNFVRIHGITAEEIQYNLIKKSLKICLKDAIALLVVKNIDASPGIDDLDINYEHPLSVFYEALIQDMSYSRDEPLTWFRETFDKDILACKILDSALMPNGNIFKIMQDINPENYRDKTVVFRIVIEIKKIISQQQQRSPNEHFDYPLPSLTSPTLNGEYPRALPVSQAGENYYQPNGEALAKQRSSSSDQDAGAEYLSPRSPQPPATTPIGSTVPVRVTAENVVPPKEPKIDSQYLKYLADAIELRVRENKAIIGPQFSVNIMFDNVHKNAADMAVAIRKLANGDNDAIKEITKISDDIKDLTNTVNLFMKTLDYKKNVQPEFDNVLKDITKQTDELFKHAIYAAETFHKEVLEKQSS